MLEPSQDELRDLVQGLYVCFETGFDFETFLKLVLLQMGLQDVTVTRRSRDGGIDLTARRVGLEELSHVDEIAYVVQAKRYAPDKPVKIESVRALRGVMPASSKGLFITTGYFSGDTESFAAGDASRPILLVDGEKLVRLCIDHKIGFDFRPVFSAESLRAQVDGLPGAATLGSRQTGPVPTGSIFLKTITSNDIRARIVSVPAPIAERLPKDADSLTIEFSPYFPPRLYAYRTDRKYLAGVTDVLRRFGLLGPRDARFPRSAEWIVGEDARMLRVLIAQNSDEVG
jgi:restriction system protein